VLEKKNKAVACHASQGGMRITKGPMDSLRKFFGISDPFMRAYPPATNTKNGICSKESTKLQGVQVPLPAGLHAPDPQNLHFRRA
jgi:hypothetical protein